MIANGILARIWPEFRAVKSVWTTLRVNGEPYSQASRPEGTTLMRFAIVIEQAEDNYSAYVPDLPGCVATGDTVKEVEREIRDAIRFYIEGLRADGPPS
jgi:predicted RNase H-like HicB family nuclease